MIIAASILTLLICWFMLSPRYDGGGIHYNLALVCVPCVGIAVGAIVAIWLGAWLLS